MYRSRFVLPTVIAVAVAALVLLEPGSVSGAATKPATEYLTLVTPSSTASPRVLSKAALINLQKKAAVVNARAGIAPAVSVMPYSVASGFVLYNPGYKRTPYVYDSDWTDYKEYKCNSTCVQISDEQTQLHEYIVGGYSRQWQLTLNAKTISESPGYSHHYSYEYHCAINVAGNPDHYCVNGADPSGSGALNPGDTLYRYFEYNNYPNTEYPMVKFVVSWSTGDVASFANRGYDVCTTLSSTKLCDGSGTGA